MHFRCSICNSVSSPEIETTVGDHRPGRFFEDPKNKLFMICSKCFEEIQSTKDEMEDSNEISCY